jgi:acetyl-CoA decarbonylase/synthase complex subunit gamma
MALSGIQIYKLLPQTNCKDCGFPTCLAFAMKLAAKQVELSACPHVTAESKTQLMESSEPPVRLIALKSNGFEVKSGNEVVLFRHEKTFYNKPGIFLRVHDQDSLDEIKSKIKAADQYMVNYVGIELRLDGFAVEAGTGDPDVFAKTVAAVREISHKPLILISRNPEAIAAGLKILDGERPLLSGADANNWQAMTTLAKQHGAALGVTANTLDGLADLTTKIKEQGVNDLVLEPQAHGLGDSLILNTQIRRLALRKNFRPLGYPLLMCPGDAEDSATEAILAAHAIAKYAGFIIIDRFAPEAIYPLLVLRENIYTDPQKPIQVLPGIYEINNPTADSPVLVTTNFSITYFSVANEVESSGLPAWLVVTDAEGMSVLTAWAAGKFDAERIAKAIKTLNIADKVNKKRIIIPGHVAVLSGELEGELPGWEIRVGPREAVDLPSFIKQAL